jgi:membrane protein YdbS with pleckstrin-like domain
MRPMDTHATSHRLFHSFCIRPATRFDTQGDKEQVLLVLRSHPITFFFPVLNGTFFFILLFIMNFFLPSFLSMSQILFLNAFILIFIFNYLWLHFLNWYFNVGIITDERIVDVDFNAILFKQTTYTDLTHVEDITAKTGGYIESLFDFGNIFVQTAGTETNTEFLNVPHPAHAAKIITELTRNIHAKP